jgi:5'-nucleotidase
MPKHILLTNDDGIESKFLHAIASALSGTYRISVAAPKSEQSWIGRAVSRRGEIEVKEQKDLPWQAWSIDGTPTDCVNIAMGNLLDGRPDAVVSGINIGYNTTTQLIYSSGTVAGALEGAFWGLPSIAVSQEIPDHIFWEVSDGKGKMPPDWQHVLDNNAAHAASLIDDLLQNGNHGGDGGDAIVHNLNYPSKPREPYITVRTVPAPLREMSFFQSTGNGGYEFQFRHGESRHSSAKTDRQAIADGEVSHSILNFSALGRDLNH